MELTLPPFDYRIKKREGVAMIFDVVRRKYVVLTPEEWVRQHVVHYLYEGKGCPLSLLAVEREIVLYGLKRRFDLVAFARDGRPWLLVECKAPTVTLSQKVFDQAFGYNLIISAVHVAVTNGVSHFCGYRNREGRLVLEKDFPSFDTAGTET